MSKITQPIVEELLKLKADKNLFHREQKDLEFKESFNFSGLAEYLRDFAAFANNKGGYVIFGVTNSPRKLKGLTIKSLKQFSKIDEESISGFINEHFSPYLDWEMNLIEVNKKKFGVFYVNESIFKPVICKKGEDRSTIKNGEIYYRYAGRTEVIQYAELSYIINNRIAENNKLWLKKVKKISELDPMNVAILDTKSGIIEGGNRTLLIDKDIIDEIDFIREGEFNERKGSKTLKLIGSVKPVNTVEIAKIVKKRLIDDYPFSYKELEKEIKKIKPYARIDKIQKIIKENNLKNDIRYSAYNFRNKNQEDKYKKTGGKLKSIPSIYNQAALEFILKVIDKS